jgi:hypothetical protein
MTKQYRVVVTDTNGKETAGEAIALADGEVEQLHDIMRQLGDLTSLNVETYRGTVFFNVKHVVSVIVQELDL